MRTPLLLLLFAVLQTLALPDNGTLGRQNLELSRKKRSRNSISDICDCDCGRRPFYAPSPVVQGGYQKRIVGGWKAKPHSHPWLARIVPKHNTEITHCGGTVINNLFILTAAHCFDNKKLQKDNLCVIIGENKQIMDEYEEIDYDETNGGRCKMIREVVIAKRYNSKTYFNDIALVKLTEPIEFSDRIQPACIPSFDKDPPGYYGFIAGWGDKKYGLKKQPNDLLETKIFLMSVKKCNRTHGNKKITTDMICGGDKIRDSCPGDSGGPLIIKRRGRYEVHGVISWGRKCGALGKPGVYTRVFNYLKWMKSVMQTECVNCPLGAPNDYEDNLVK